MLLQSLLLLRGSHTAGQPPCCMYMTTLLAPESTITHQCNTVSAVGKMVM
jgi:hypothetical protein